MPKPRYQISTRTMLSHIEKLNLQKGDVIVCRDLATLEYLSRVQLPLGFIVPLVFSPQGVEKLNRQDLLNLIEQLDEGQHETSSYAEMPSAPL